MWVNKLSINLQILLPLQWHRGEPCTRSRCLSDRDICPDLYPGRGWCNTGQIVSGGPAGEAGSTAFPCWWRRGRRSACSSCHLWSAAWWRCGTARWSPPPYLRRVRKWWRRWRRWGEWQSLAARANENVCANRWVYLLSPVITPCVYLLGSIPM